jgi:tetratricopeptide (TPR) repeat protein
MSRVYGLCAGFAVAVILWSGGTAGAADVKPAQPAVFGALQSIAPDSAREQALAWLKSTGKTDANSLQAFDVIWSTDQAVLDKVTATFCLGDAEAAALMTEAKRVGSPAPLEVPDLLRDAKRPLFYRSNLTLAYAKALSNRRVYEEALDALNNVKAEQVVDPATYLFHKAVSEHALTDRLAANTTIIRLLDDVADAPERYKMVSALMVYDMLGWQEKDLGWVSRKMDNIERRLELARGGPTTQKMQKQVVARLDEMIKELENQGKNGNCNGGNCPNGGRPGNNPNNTINPSAPQQDSNGGTGTGPGNVDPRKLKEIADVWGKLPEKERAKAMTDMTRDMPPKYREVIENYFKNLDSGKDKK